MSVVKTRFRRFLLVCFLILWMHIRKSKRVSLTLLFKRSKKILREKRQQSKKCLWSLTELIFPTTSRKDLCFVMNKWSWLLNFSMSLLLCLAKSSTLISTIKYLTVTKETTDPKIHYRFTC